MVLDLYNEILTQVLSEKISDIILEHISINIDANQLVKESCYQTLQHIKTIVEDDTLDDPECFHRIEKIICTLEERNISTGSRHDFG